MRLSKKGDTASWASSPKTNVVDVDLMSRDEFRQLCADLGINDCLDAAELFGLSWRTCQRYHYGDLDVPGPLARLLRMTHAHPRGIDALRKLPSRRAPRS
jgi:hypothetical protein